MRTCALDERTIVKEDVCEMSSAELLARKKAAGHRTNEDEERLWAVL